MTPTAAFPIEEFQLQRLARHSGQRVEDLLETFGIPAMPGANFFAIRQQPYTYAIAVTSGNPEYDKC